MRLIMRKTNDWLVCTVRNFFQMQSGLIQFQQSVKVSRTLFPSWFYLSGGEKKKKKKVCLTVFFLLVFALRLITQWTEVVVKLLLLSTAGQEKRHAIFGFFFFPCKLCPGLLQ